MEPIRELFEKIQEEYEIAAIILNRYEEGNFMHQDNKKVVELLQKREKVCALLAPTVERTWGNSITKEQFDKWKNGDSEQE